MLKVILAAAGAAAIAALALWVDAEPLQAAGVNQTPRIHPAQYRPSWRNCNGRCVNYWVKRGYTHAQAAWYCGC